ncbi:mandelate racemase/muconate lactonizing enzyme family protein [Streptomyces sp. NPDC085932]|uniref:mandelate racemase/muconate lactonizing enzyme family protein n=1 Tax=Streptomyces sp. NPDC085932 TaxID=3365741 RepID=UPI0037D38872
MAKISGFDALWSRIPLGQGRGGSGATQVDLIQVSIASDDGETGSGFTYALSGGAEALYALLTGYMRQSVLGTELEEWPRTWATIWHSTHRLGRGVAIPALSAVDIAVWDVRARRADLPLYRLLGAHHTRIPVYGSGRSNHRMTMEELVEGQRRYVDEGYNAVKIRIGAHRTEEDVERVAAVRQALGERVRIMVDCNERLDLPSALRLGRHLAELDVHWMEEPLPSDDIVGHAQLAERTGIPIAVGEHLIGRFEFAGYLRAGAASVVQPDVPLTGGVTEWLRISAVSEVFGAVLAPHFLPELHVHLAAAVPNCSYLEHFPLIDDVLDETLDVSEGMASPPDRPGHGMRWNAHAIDKFRQR